MKRYHGRASSFFWELPVAPIMAGWKKRKTLWKESSGHPANLFASNQLRPGDLWKIYILASDPDGDMETLVAVVDQVGWRSYPVSTTKIKGENTKELFRVFLFLNTSTPWTAFFDTKN